MIAKETWKVKISQKRGLFMAKRKIIRQPKLREKSNDVFTHSIQQSILYFFEDFKY